MKNNLISAIAGWKSAALLALVAMVAAVAFSGVLTNTESADAQTADVTTSAGRIVEVVFDADGSGLTAVGTTYRFRIAPDSTASGSFASVLSVRNGTFLSCTEGVAVCDADDNNGDGAAATGADVTITLKISVDADSDLGEIYVQRIERATTGTIGVETVAEEKVVAVTRPATTPARLTVTPSALAASANGGSVTLDIEVLSSRRTGIAQHLLTVTTSNGVLNDVEDADGEAGATHGTSVGTGATKPDPNDSNATVPNLLCNNSLGCYVTTRAAIDAVVTQGTDNTAVDDPADRLAVAAGTAQLTLTGAGRSGVATVTVTTLTGLEHSVEIVLHSTATGLSVASDQSSVSVGGSTFIVATVTDRGGQPVADQVVRVSTGPNAPSGPDTDAVPVEYDEGIGRPRLAPAPPIPACSVGTDGFGQCAIKVYATQQGVDPDAGTDAMGAATDDVDAGADQNAARFSATRGEHTITLEIDLVPEGVATESAVILVSGAPSEIDTSAAPGSVEPLSSTPITVTVLDDENAPVGAVPISVVQVDGSGRVDDVPGGMTSDGSATFTYLAPLSAGEAVFLVRVNEGTPGQIQATVTVAIGDAAAEEDPEAPAATWNNELVSGQNVVVWNGDDGADASAGSADGVTAIWSYNTGSGSWDGYFPEAADVPGGNTLTSLSSNQAYVVIVN